MKAISTSFLSLAKKGKAVAAFLFLSFVLPAISVAQPDPGGGGDPGGDPGGGGPPTVPFDDKLNYILIAFAIVFAVVMYKKYQKKLAK